MEPEKTFHLKYVKICNTYTIARKEGRDFNEF